MFAKPNKMDHGINSKNKKTALSISVNQSKHKGINASGGGHVRSSNDFHDPCVGKSAELRCFKIGQKATPDSDQRFQIMGDQWFISE